MLTEFVVHDRVAGESEEATGLEPVGDLITEFIVVFRYLIYRIFETMPFVDITFPNRPVGNRFEVAPTPGKVIDDLGEKEDVFLPQLRRRLLICSNMLIDVNNLRVPSSRTIPCPLESA